MLLEIHSQNQFSHGSFTVLCGKIEIIILESQP